MTDCIGGFAIPTFETATLGSIETRYGAIESAAPAVPCQTTLTPPHKAECADFTKWSQWTGAACYLFKTAALIVEAEVKNQKVMQEVYASLGIVYGLIYGANQAFNQAIGDVNQGKPFTPIINPVNPPPFPPINKGDDIAAIIQSAWNAIEPFLEQAITKIQNKDPKSKWIIILQGIIENSDATVQQIVNLLNAVEGK